MDSKVKKISGSIGSILMSDAGDFSYSRASSGYAFGEKAEGNLYSKMSFDEQIKTLQLEREQLKSEREEDISDAFERARKEGYEAGYEEGKANGIRDIFTQNKDKIEQANTLISSISSALEKKARDQSQMISDAISDSLVKSYFLASSVDSNSILRIVKAAMESLPMYAKTITINCSEFDFSIISEFEASVPVKVNSLLNPGEVEIDSDVGLVRVTGESITERLLDRILEERE